MPKSLVQLPKRDDAPRLRISAIAFDGDGDRIGDGRHRPHPLGGWLMTVLARDALQHHPSASPTSRRATLFREVALAGSKPVMLRSGHLPTKKARGTNRSISRGDERPNFLRRPLVRLQQHNLCGGELAGDTGAQQAKPHLDRGSVVGVQHAEATF